MIDTTVMQHTALYGIFPMFLIHDVNGMRIKLLVHIIVYEQYDVRGYNDVSLNA